MEIPEIHYARNAEVALAFQVLVDGPDDLEFLPAFINNLEIAWESPHHARFLRRLASFSRLVLRGWSSRTAAVRACPIACLPRTYRRSWS